MKNIKKLLSIVMMLALVLSLGAQAFAATVEIGSANGLPNTHQYTAYQIFTGSQAAAEGELGDIQWGADIDSTKFVEALQKSEEFGAPNPFAGLTEAKDIAEALGKIDNASAAKAFGKIALNNLQAGAQGTVMTPSEGKVAANLAKGYYVIKDTTPADDLKDGEVFNDILVQVVNDLEIVAKNEGPSSQKKVKDVNDSEDKDGDNPTDWQDSADYDIGDDVPYELTVTIPSVSAYDKYYVHMIDIISKGLTYNGDAVITLTGTDSGTKESKTVTVTGDFVSGSTRYDTYDGDKPAEGDYAGGTVLTWNNEDIIALAEKNGIEAPFTIKVNYTAELNVDAKIGVAGNPNTFTFRYKRNPNEEGDGHTPWDTNIVFTFNQSVNKVDPSGNEVAGAGFTLLKEIPEAEAMGATDVTWETLGKQVKNTIVKYNGKYYKVVHEEITGVTTFDFKGIDDGNYVLVETTVPAGYNRADDILFQVEAEHEIEADYPVLKSLTVKIYDKASEEYKEMDPSKPVFNIDMNRTNNTEANIEGNVVNDHGAKLPETGGMGTTIFYTVGAILVVGAVILLVTRKRVSGASK